MRTLRTRLEALERQFAPPRDYPPPLEFWRHEGGTYTEEVTGQTLTAAEWEERDARLAREWRWPGRVRVGVVEMGD